MTYPEPTYICVKTDHSEEGLFSNHTETPPTNWDDKPLLDKLTAEIAKLYPTAKVEVTAVYEDDSVRISTDGSIYVESAIIDLIDSTWFEWISQFK